MAATFGNLYSLDTLEVKNFDETTLSPMAKEIEPILCFRTFSKNSEWPPFRKIFSKVGIVYSLDTLGVENFNEITLFPTVKEMETVLCFHTFSKNSEWPPFRKNFSKVGIVYSLDTLGVENFDEIALSPTVKEMETILCFHTFSKNLKF